MVPVLSAHIYNRKEGRDREGAGEGERGREGGREKERKCTM
jgi:hypothetical protein